MSMAVADPARDAADLALMIDVARAAAEIALARRASGFETWDKAEGQGPVTEADLEIDRMMRTDLLAARPDYGWLSEETEDDPSRRAARLGADRVFVIDPIDGTRAYAAGEDGFCHALAVVRGGVAVAGVVLMPVTGAVYAATLGGGATRDGAAIAPSGRTALEGAGALVTAAGLKPERWPGGAPPVKRHFRASLASRLCFVAEGQFDLSISVGPVWEWDAAAGALIAAEAGAGVADAAGRALRLNAPDPRLTGLVVAAPALLAPVLARLAPGG